MLSSRWLQAISFFLLIPLFSNAQAPRQMHVGELQLALKKLNVLGSALYLAAHPDDENTALLAYLANDRLVRSAYLSLTRGDGGQNLIGPEQRELMGLIRTQELLQARRIDGSEQYFTRANDFGYSKNAKETKEIWGEEAVLSDIVWVIRKYRPDVIITRFPPTRDAGHGHHEASAMLGIEAFAAAADPKRFPEQLKYVKPWQAKRIVWNAYSRRRGTFSNLPPDSLISTPIEIGTYNPLLGKSHTVIAAESRSMHRSQGFGATKQRGERTDNLGHLAGESSDQDLFADIELSWERIPQGEVIGQTLQEAYENFEPVFPHKILPLLLKAYQQMEAYRGQDDEAKFWIEIKKKELKAVIAQSLGLWLEANGTEYAVSAGDSLEIKLEALNRSPETVALLRLRIQSRTHGLLAELDSLPQALGNNQPFEPYISVKIPEQEQITQPYWLREEPTKGLFQVSDQEMIGQPENPSALLAEFTLDIAGQEVTFSRPLTYKWTKADEGELYRSLEITPAVMVNLEDQILMFANESPKTVSLTLKAGRNQTKGSISLELPEGWKLEPKQQVFDIAEKGAEQKVSFQVTPPSEPSEGKLRAKVQLAESDQRAYARGIRRIDYRHIPIQTVFPQAEAKLVRVDVQIKGKNIGYIEGAGDDIPQNLRQIGYQVSILDEEALEKDISQFDAIMVGVRAYNTQPWLQYDHAKLLEYVKQGGTLVTQYHTPWRMVVEELGPYPFEISRGRVTVEEAPVRFEDKEHPILNYPNQITEQDFEGWVQERGLYFADKWDEHYQTPLAANDPGEESLVGGLLYTEYGEGKFIYTGYSFFRELPAGVSGAYRLLVNLLSQ